MPDWVPLLNLGLVLAFFAFVVIKQAGWTAPSLRAGIDQLFRLHSQLRRELKDSQREVAGWKADLERVHQSIETIHGRITTVDEEWAARLNRIESGLARLACIEQEWHQRGKPDWCPMHSNECPLGPEPEARKP